MKLRNLSSVAFVVGATLAAPVVAAAAPGADAGKAKATNVTLSDADKAVLQHHHAVNVFEIDMGKLAATRASAPVKKYGAMLVADHTKADKQALALAKARGAKLEDHPAPSNEAEAADHKKHMELMDKLKTLEGAAFDREYLTAMEEGHTKEVGYLATAIAGVADTKLKAHLETVKPVVEKHATQAKDLLAKVPASTDAGGAKPNSGLAGDSGAEPMQTPAPSPAKPNPNPAPVKPLPTPAKPNPNPSPAPSNPAPVNPPRDGGAPPVDGGVPPADAPKAPIDAPKAPTRPRS